MRVFGLAGRAGSGKTSLMVRLVSELAGRGVTVSAVTDVRDPDEIDRPGKDSFRHCAAGAEEVVVASALRWALIRGRRDDAEPGFDDIVARMTPVDLVLVDGGGRGDHPRLEVHRAAHSGPPLCHDDPRIVAVASDAAVAAVAVPVLDLADVAAVADFIVGACGLKAA